ncbi:MAG: PSD1 and planctomycete cytochrome C domain-containing protein [Pirellulaceae bacterium]
MDSGLAAATAAGAFFNWARSTLMRYRITFATVLFSMATIGSAGAQDDAKPDAKAIAFFESNVRPILVRHCYDCHSAQEGAAEGGLRVDSRTAIRKGGERGPAVVPGRPDASLLLTAVSHTDSDLKMPPKEAKLSPSVLADLKKWIEMGAPDPRVGEQVEASELWNGLESAKNHWAYQPPITSRAPDVSDPAWGRDLVDVFVLAKLDEAELKPSAEAEPHVLLRRLHFDLVGLPPSPKSLDQFKLSIDRNGIDQAIEAEVDRLLESPQFGERWGRHWLDVARFGESSGGESNVSFPYAWRYRDYVIDAVNADVPYNQFLTEQIAGDLLPADSDAERARLLTATGFLAVGTKNLGENNDEKFQADLVDEQIDALTRAVMGSSVACARCHHHKFDPFSMEDYYGLAGIFASSETFFGTFTSPANNRGGHPLSLPRVPGQVVFHESLTPAKFEKLKTRQAELAAVRTEIQTAQKAAWSGKKPEKTFTLRDVLANRWQLGPVEGKLETLDEVGQALPLAMGILDGEILNVPLLARGEIGREGAIVARAFPQAIPVGVSITIPADQSGRLQLAQWLTSPDHPLTSRVFVNRVWKHVFGRGIVATVDNLGTSGEAPSHPELLDTLAVRFANDGWSLKRLVRSLMLSRTYRQASTFDSLAFQKDPENALLWRMPKRRLEAEAIRDAMLMASGEIDLKRPGGSLVAKMIGDRPISLIGLDKKLPKDLDGSVHRSVYLPVIRDRLPDVLSLFDFAEPSLVTGERETTNVPVQAFYLMNSSFVQERAQALAARLHREATDNEDFVVRAFELSVARSPVAKELQRSLEFLAGDDEATRLSFCQAMLCTAEFRNLD